MDNENLRRLSRLATGRRFWVLAAALCVAGPATAADNKKPDQTGPATSTKSNADRARVEREAAIRASAAAFVKAFNARDAKAIANMWIPDGTVADDEGRLIKGRHAIEDEYAALFKAHPTARMEVSVKSVEFPTAAMAIEDGISQVLTRDSAPPSAARYTAVHVLDGRKMAHRHGPRDGACRSFQLPSIAGTGLGRRNLGIQFREYPQAVPPALDRQQELPAA